MKKLSFKSLFQSEIVRNSSVLLSGNVLGQAIALLAIPILTRMYSNSDFGVFALFLSFTGVLSVVSTGKYEEALVMTKTKNESSALLKLSIYILLLFTLVIFFFLLFCGNSCFSLLNMEVLNDYRFIIPLFVFTTGIFNIFTNLSNREKYYSTIAGSNLSSNLLSSLFKIAANFFKTNAGGLIGGQFIGQFLACFSFYKLKDIIRQALKSSWHQMRKVAETYREFPYYNMPRSFINYFSSNLPFFFLTGVFGEAKSGLYFMAFNVTFRPISLISNSIYQVVFEKTSELKRNNQKISSIINPFWNKTLLYLFPLFAIVFIFAPFIFRVVFGVNWEESGTYFRYILPWLFLVFLTTPMGFLPLLFNKQKIAMYLEFAYFIFRGLALYCGIYLSDFKLAIILFSAVGFIFMLITFVWYRLIIKNYEKNYA